MYISKKKKNAVQPRSKQNQNHSHSCNIIATVVFYNTDICSLKGWIKPQLGPGDKISCGPLLPEIPQFNQSTTCLRFAVSL